MISVLDKQGREIDCCRECAGMVIDGRCLNCGLLAKELPMSSWKHGEHPPVLPKVREHHSVTEAREAVVEAAREFVRKFNAPCQSTLELMIATKDLKIG